ncbi:zf-HC2 domain-containing protein [Vreelandella neptunia]|uniref:zf-HC2 domain-containing protein n=1 Tax=Vreelandella neptunia TaxID=115551 RepID=UPI002795F7B7|nr:zf-HC2 domain-containing protein [Halomonas neptunia]
MLMCREATGLMSLKLEKALSLREKIALKVHLSICPACRHCVRQFDLLHKIGNRHPASLRMPEREQDD